MVVLVTGKTVKLVDYEKIDVVFLVRAKGQSFIKLRPVGGFCALAALYKNFEDLYSLPLAVFLGHPLLAFQTGSLNLVFGGYPAVNYGCFLL